MFTLFVLCTLVYEKTQALHYGQFMENNGIPSELDVIYKQCFLYARQDEKATYLYIVNPLLDCEGKKRRLAWQFFVVSLCYLLYVIFASCGCKSLSIPKFSMALSFLEWPRAICIC